MSWWSTCFAWRGTVLPHVLGRVGLLTGFSVLLYLIDELVFRPARHLPALDPLGHTVFGVALSMLIVFRTNSSNNRYWEARSHWGMIVNTSRNLVRMGAVWAGPADDLARLVSAYVLMVKEQLRDNPDPEAVRHLVPGRILDRMTGVNNPASVLAGYLSEWVALRQQEGRIDSILASRLEGLIGVLVDQQGGCEKIQK